MARTRIAVPASADYPLSSAGDFADLEDSDQLSELAGFAEDAEDKQRRFGAAERMEDGGWRVDRKTS
jgi:hypothetical protein